MNCQWKDYFFLVVFLPRREGRRVGVFGAEDRYPFSDPPARGGSSPLRIFSARSADASGTMTLTLLATPMYIPSVLLVFGPMSTAEMP